MRQYVWLIDGGDPQAGTLGDYADDLHHAALVDVDVSRVVWELRTDGPPIEHTPMIDSSGFDEDQWATITVSLNGEDASYRIDGRT